MHVRMEREFAAGRGVLGRRDKVLEAEDPGKQRARGKREGFAPSAQTEREQHLANNAANDEIDRPVAFALLFSLSET